MTESEECVCIIISKAYVMGKITIWLDKNSYNACNNWISPVLTLIYHVALAVSLRNLAISIRSSSPWKDLNTENMNYDVEKPRCQ